MKIIVLFIVLFLMGCASSSKFQNQCEELGFGIDSADFAVCVERQTKKVREYLEMQEAEEKAKAERFYRELERKRLGLDIR